MFGGDARSVSSASVAPKDRAIASRRVPGAYKGLGLMRFLPDIGAVGFAFASGPFLLRKARVLVVVFLVARRTAVGRARGTRDEATPRCSATDERNVRDAGHG